MEDPGSDSFTLNPKKVMELSASWAALGGPLSREGQILPLCPAPGKLYPVLGSLARESYRATEERPVNGPNDD